SAGSGGWSAPREQEARKQKLPPLQLFNLKNDQGERNNLAESNPDQVNALLSLLKKEVDNGRCTPGKAVANDREVTFLPNGVTMPWKK
ncbi:MAG: arylsulfatase, partial [Akkermansiaceae bacterium]